ncbi:MAG: cation-translocating P-type ATPase [Hyphomicrobiales bacterium]|nr:cation-translocating P-type ATPase [Hyphomicrobiales bacterium]
MDCTLCKLPVPTPPIESDGHAFCCLGCREVYNHFGEDILTQNVDQTSAQDTPIPEGAEAFLRIEGMHCSSCEILIERTAQKIDGVLAVASSYATATTKVIYDPDRVDGARLPELIKLSGYRARLRSEGLGEYDDRMSLLRVVAATSISSVIMMLYLAFFYPTHLGIVAIEELEPVGWLAFYATPRLMFFLTTVLVFYCGAPIFRGAWTGLRVGVLNMDNLLSIAILAAYGYSVGQLFAGSLELYFDVATAIVTVVTVGRYFEQGARAEATGALTKLMDVCSPVARIRKGRNLLERNVDELEPGDRVVVWPGEPIPLNGTIIKGQAAVDESLMTGEPFPVSRGTGDEVVGGAIVVEGELEIEAGAQIESQMDTLARVLWNVQSSLAGARGLADRIARTFVPGVLVLAAFTTTWMLVEQNPLGAALLTGLATLIVSCPCTFGFAMPLTTAAAVSTALRRGVIFTSADVFEKAPQIDIVALDKTGTLSTGKMTVVKTLGRPRVVAYAAAVERRSAHPIARAIAQLDDQHDASDFVVHPGRGAVAMVDGSQVAVGSKSLFAALGWDIPEDILEHGASVKPGEGVVSYVGWDGGVCGAIITCDESRPEWQDVVDRLSSRVRVVLLTGAEHPSGYEDRVNEVYAGVPPEAKAAVIRRLRSEGTVVMIGDGSNDAPALAAADLGIAFGAPTALAADAADVIIPGDRLDRIFDAFDLIDTTRRRVRQNLGWALLYNALAIPLAVTGYLNPLFAALAMSTSSLLVVWNSSRPINTTEAPGLAQVVTPTGPDRPPGMRSART